MAITVTSIELSEARFVFDGAGNVTDVLLEASYILQDSAGKNIGRQTSTGSIWAQLTATQQAQANAIGQRLRALAPTVVPT